MKEMDESVLFSYHNDVALGSFRIQVNSYVAEERLSIWMIMWH